MNLSLKAMLPWFLPILVFVFSGAAFAASQRVCRVEDIAVPEGYVIELVSRGLTFPTGVTFDSRNRPHVVESGYSYGEVWTKPRLLRIEPDGSFVLLAEGEKNGPWNGVCFHKGAFYVAEGGVLEGGRILKIYPGGIKELLVEDLPSRGDHHTNGPLIAPDGWLYFSIGTATNSGVVGEDNAEIGWLKRYAQFHDIACEDVILRGGDFSSSNPVAGNSRAPVATGAFSPFGTRTEKGQVIKGSVPCSGSVLRIRPEGGRPELVAWGFRNPFGLAFSPAGHLYVTDNMYDVRGSRPVFGAGDLLWKVVPGTWYGWPDFHGGVPLNSGNRYKPFLKPGPAPLLMSHPNKPPLAAAILAVHSSSGGFDFSSNPDFGHVGQAFIAQFGDQSPASGAVHSPVGFKVVRVDVSSGIITDFAVNRGTVNGPASLIGGGGLERPVAARFDNSGEALYVVDFGILEMTGKGPVPKKGTGSLWKITKKKEAQEGKEIDSDEEIILYARSDSDLPDGGKLRAGTEK